MVREPEVMVLMSGGIDSSACVDFYVDFGRPVCGLFVDYGQLSARAEWAAATRIAQYYSIALQKCTWVGIRDRNAGLMPGRNLLLVAAALFERPDSVGAIAMGLHSGTDYADCSPDFVRAAKSVIAEAGLSSCDLAAPFLQWQKTEVYAYAKKRKLPLDFTYSCEAGNEPCGVCLSCQDRNGL